MAGEVVALAELLPNDVDDVLGVGVVLGEDQGLRDLGPAGEDFREQPLLERPDHSSDLVRGNDGAVELAGLVLKFLVGFLPAHLPGRALAVPHVHARFDLAAHLGRSWS